MLRRFEMVMVGRGAWWGLVILVLGGCLGPEAAECPGGGLCPPGTTCLILGEAPRCVPFTCGDGQLDFGEACDDGNHTSGDGCPADCGTPCGDGVVDPGEACDDGNRTSGDGCPADCGTSCGDDIVQPGEACDDGNVVSGDGCSSDCRSNERCGNGAKDTQSDERCDDGNLGSHDGCASTCIEEQPAWGSYDAVPSARAGQALAYDAARGKIVMFGGRTTLDQGCSSALSDETWESDGVSWLQRATGNAPAGRVGHAMVYDAARDRVILFGGCRALDGASCTVTLNDTWEWDGAKWLQRASASAPPARFGHRLAYDAIRRKVVLFGGETAPLYPSGPPWLLGDTWEWDGTDWIQQHSMAPSARVWHAMTYDSQRGRVVLFGGQDGAPLDDTWEWDGDTWSRWETNLAPLARAGHELAYDPAARRVLLFGGCLGATAGLLWDCASLANDAWAWNGVEWKDLGPGELPARMSFGMAFDVGRSSALLFGGKCDAALLGDTWEWVGSGWIQRTRGATPEGEIAAAYDAARGKVVVFGGKSGNETWEWDGAWIQQIPATTPDPRTQHSLIYDAAHRTVLLFGGRDREGPLDDTWLWDGERWSPQVNLSVTPPARAHHALAYDPQRARVVLFGGDNGLDPASAEFRAFNDTWEWDGSGWQERPTSTKPAVRYRHAMAYDAPAGAILLFGGFVPVAGSPIPLNDLWEWNGVEWKQRLSNPVPRPRGGHVLTYNPLRRAIMLFGGTTPDASTPLDDTWEWNGTSWTPLKLPVRPQARQSHAMVHDGVREQIVLLGERDGGSDDAWTFRFESTAPAEACTTGLDGDHDGLIGCADPDCAGFCAPVCASSLVCDGNGPRCGDGVCGALEGCRLCPADCGDCPAVCGDFHCDPEESCATCPSDCPCP